MPIPPAMTLITTLTVRRCCRLYGRPLLALAIGLVACAISCRAVAAEKLPKAPKPPAASRVVKGEADPLKKAEAEALLPVATSSSTLTRTATHGTTFCNGIRAQDEIVLVSTRQICGCCDDADVRAGIRVEQYTACDEVGHRRWTPGDLQSFLSSDPSVPTLIFVHGNQISPWDAKCEGLQVYRSVILHGNDAPPMRYVIFSWPSTEISGGLLNDIRVKAMRTGPAGCQLAWLIDQLPEETRLTLTGFSFGARIITGSLHVLAGGSLGGRMTLAEHVHPQRSPMNVVLMASAVHAHWLGDNQYHGLAMTQVNRMFLFNNCDDPAMKYYDFIEPGLGGPQALGLCGPTCISRENAHKIMMRDMSCSVGAQHNLHAYICAPGVAGTIWDYTANGDGSPREPKSAGGPLRDPHSDRAAIAAH